MWELKYGLGIGKLATKIKNGNSFALKPSSQNKYVNEYRTFFCSELVAKAYKVLKVFITE